MGMFDKKISFKVMKGAVTGAVSQVSETSQRVDVKPAITSESAVSTVGLRKFLYKMVDWSIEAIHNFCMRYDELVSI